MKHTFTFVFFVAAISVFGQTEKGNSFISGNISTRYSAGIYPKEWPRKSNEAGFSTGISYGKFVKDNIVWKNSLYGEFSRIFNQTNTGSQSTAIIYPNTLISLSSVGLYYFGKERWRGFVGGGLEVSGTFNKTRNKETGGAMPYDYTQKNAMFTLRPVVEAGALYFLNKHLALQLSTKTNSFPINLTEFYSGLVYWIKPTSFDIEPKELTTLQKGRWMLGAGFGVNTTKYRNSDPNNTYTSQRTHANGNLNLQIGKLIKNRTMIGMNLGYSGGKNIQSYNSGQKTTNYSNNYNTGIFLKKYLLPTRFTPYFEADIYYYRGVYKQVSDNLGTNTSQSNIYGLGPSLGLTYIINNHFLVETQLADFYLY